MINLIPPKLKRERSINKSIDIVLSSLLILLFLLIVISVAVYFEERVVRVKLSTIEIKTKDLQKTITEYENTENTVNQINAKLAKIDAIDQKRVIWSVILKNLAQSVPAQVKINSASFDQKNDSLSLSGEAETRTDIANFKDKLENSDYFKNVYFSTSAYNNEKNNFSFSLTAVLEKIK